MNYEAGVLGSEFSQWQELTDKYVAGMEALRRREPGASAYMSQLAGAMRAYQGRLADSGPWNHAQTH